MSIYSAVLKFQIFHQKTIKIRNFAYQVPESYLSKHLCHSTSTPTFACLLNLKITWSMHKGNAKTAQKSANRKGKLSYVKLIKNKHIICMDLSWNAII